jgi:protoporphyrinogen oxidase
MSERQYKAIVVGAGPAGLTGAYELAKNGQRVVVLESDPEYVGGISRTVSDHGYRFDIGGHRFFSKSREVEDLWTEILGSDMLQRPRSSKIYYGGQFYSYPCKITNHGHRKWCRIRITAATGWNISASKATGFGTWQTLT